MSIFRVEKTKDYTVMSNYHLKDKRLSLKAKGLLSWMLSNNDDWDYSLAGIVACCKEGETTVNTALRELQRYGYVQIVKNKPDETNNRIHYDYNVYEIPQDIDSQGVESLVLESQALENQPQINTNIRNTKKRNTNKETISKDIVENFQFGTKQSKSKKLSLYEKCVNLIHDFTDDVILQGFLEKTLQMFLMNSRESGMPFYTNTFKGKLNKLKSLSEDNYEQRKIVKQTIDNGWNNYYEVRENKYKGKTNNVARDIEHLSGLAERAKKGGRKSEQKF